MVKYIHVQYHTKTIYWIFGQKRYLLQLFVKFLHDKKKSLKNHLPFQTMVKTYHYAIKHKYTVIEPSITKPF